MYNTKHKFFFGRETPFPRLLHKPLKTEEKA
jgi:hypothetical protein